MSPLFERQAHAEELTNNGDVARFQIFPAMGELLEHSNIRKQSNAPGIKVGISNHPRAHSQYAQIQSSYGVILNPTLVPSFWLHSITVGEPTN